jgi:hypothetical protein
MSNKTQLQINNTALDGYIARINAAKDVAASLPEAGGGSSELRYATGEFTCSSTGATVTGLGFTPKHVLAYFLGDYTMPSMGTQYYFVQTGIINNYISISNSAKYNSMSVVSVITMLDDGFTINERTFGSYTQGTWVYIAFG